MTLDSDDHAVRATASHGTARQCGMRVRRRCVREAHVVRRGMCLCVAIGLLPVACSSGAKRVLKDSPMVSVTTTTTRPKPKPKLHLAPLTGLADPFRVVEHRCAVT